MQVSVGDKVERSDTETNKERTRAEQEAAARKVAEVRIIKRCLLWWTGGHAQLHLILSHRAFGRRLK